MRDPGRIDRIVDTLREVWKLSPDLRLGQLLENILKEHVAPSTIDPFYVEDHVWEAALVRHYTKSTNVTNKG